MHAASGSCLKQKGGSVQTRKQLCGAHLKRRRSGPSLYRVTSVPVSSGPSNGGKIGGKVQMFPKRLGGHGENLHGPGHTLTSHHLKRGDGRLQGVWMRTFFIVRPWMLPNPTKMMTPSRCPVSQSTSGNPSLMAERRQLQMLP